MIEWKFRWTFLNSAKSLLLSFWSILSLNQLISKLLERLMNRNRGDSGSLIMKQSLCEVTRQNLWQFELTESGFSITKNDGKKDSELWGHGNVVLVAMPTKASRELYVRSVGHFLRMRLPVCWVYSGAFYNSSNSTTTDFDNRCHW